MENREELIQLLERYRRRECSLDEVTRLLTYIKASSDEDFRDIFLSEEERETIIRREDVSPEKLAHMDELFEQIEAKRKNSTSYTTKQIRRLLPYAAACLLIIGIGAVLYWRSIQLTDIPQLANVDVDIGPGTNRATLSLSDGNSYELSEQHTGISMQAGSIRYDDGSTLTTHTDAPIATLTTPRGGQYRITLPDGSKVWLNAASSLRYASRFDSDKREVTLAGEAYFEVVKNSKQPFIVHSKGQRTEVLGTEFNINTYTDEPTAQTTLVTGSVQIQAERTGNQADNNTDKIILKPGEQATLKSGTIQVAEVQTSAYTAWRKGQISLNQADLPAIIRQIERWYDVEFEIEHLPPSEPLRGVLKRNVPLSELLETLEEHYQVTFKQNGRRITMTK